MRALASLRARMTLPGRCAVWFARFARSRCLLHERLLAAQQDLVRTVGPRREGLAGLAVLEVVADHGGDVVVEPDAGDLVRTQLLAEAVLESERATEVHLEALDLLSVVVHHQHAL